MAVARGLLGGAAAVCRRVGVSVPGRVGVTTSLVLVLEDALLWLAPGVIANNGYLGGLKGKKTKKVEKINRFNVELGGLLGVY